MITIYHNGECSKSRGALEILQEQGIPHEVRWYLAEPLSAEEIRALLLKLDMKPIELMRQNEPWFLAHLQGAALGNDDYIQAMAEHPELIERPIVENGEKALIARPADRVLEVL